MSVMFVLVDGPSAARGPERRAVVKLTPSDTGWRLSLRWIETGRTILRYVGDEPRLLTESFLLWCSMNEIDWVADREGVDPNRVAASAPALLGLYPPTQIRAAADRLLANLPAPRPPDEDPRVALRPKLEVPAPQARAPQAAPQPVRAPAPAPQADLPAEEDVEFDRFLVQIARARKAGMSRDQALMAMHAFSDEALGEEYVEEEEEVEEAEEEFEEGEEAGLRPEPPLTMTMAPGAVATVALATPALLRPARADELPPELAGLRDPRAEAKMQRTMQRAAEASRAAQEGAAAASRRGHVAIVTEEVVKKRSLEETLVEAEAGVAEVNLLRRRYEATNLTQNSESPVEEAEGVPEEEAPAKPAKKRKRGAKG